MRFLDMNLRHIQAGQSFNSLGILEVSKVALEEIMQNALVHREYIKQAPIRLLVFDDRVEIISPGCLPDGLTVEKIKLGNTSQRNMLIATFCARTMSYRGLGSGIIRATKSGTPVDFINDEQGNELKVILWKTLKKASSDQVKASSDQVKASSDQVKASSKKEKTISKILSYCTEPRTLKDIMDCIGVTDRVKLKNRYLNPLLGKSLKMTQPNSPKSPTQKYVVIDYPLDND